jgi:sugar phosphate isomerase/epimerase
LKALSADNLKQTIENNRVLGSDYLNVAAAQDKMGSASTIAELAAFLNQAAAQCRLHKMTVGYHAHPFDFAKIDGRFAWEILFNSTKPEVNMQMDVGNCLAGGGDPIAMLKKFPGRTRTIHIKEHEAKTFDSDFYKEVFHLCETSSGTRWYIVEMGSADGNGFDVPREALAKLHRLGK